MLRFEFAFWVLFVCFTILFLTFQYIIPKLNGTQTFPSFRKSKYKQIKEIARLQSELEQVKDADKSVKLQEKLEYGNVTVINDGLEEGINWGKTPRQRILNFLYNKLRSAASIKD